ncbi:MAG: hypothetical protein LC772_07475 [Chloroflexi bacterium]|nr:hypothetical protein [Chloroflexota bacterium]
MKSEDEARNMNLTYASRCGNPECEQGQLPPGSAVIIVNKRIYCGLECASAHLAAGPKKAVRKTPARKTAPKAAAARAAAESTAASQS